MINRKFFYDYVRGHLFGGRLTQSQVNGMNAILDEWDGAYAKNDDRWLAYMLATTHHETAMRMQPIEEFGKGRGHPYGVPDPQTGQTYHGRGFVQLTWKNNYASMGTRLKVDLVNHPELALDLGVATQILFTGMMEGSFTGVKLGDYFNATKEDWINARRIINGTDRAQAISLYGKSYYASLSHTTG
jgi:hypothetical protein